MAVTYWIDKGNGIIHTSCSGQVTLEEVIDHFRALERDPDCQSHLNVLLDLSEQTSIPETANLQDVSREIRRIQGRVEFGTCAIVACSDALFGMLRMFEVFSEQLFSETYVFRSKAEAEAWLFSKHPITSARSGAV